MGLFDFFTKKEVVAVKDFSDIEDNYCLDDAGDCLNPALRAVKRSNKYVMAAYDKFGQLTLCCGTRTPKAVQDLVNAVGAKAALRLLEKAGAPVSTKAYRAVKDEEDTDTSGLEKYIEPTYYSSANVTRRR